jgi:thioesterase domain-containing protein/acyl carrier protein
MNVDDVQDIYPLTGMQQLLLVQGLRPGRSDRGFLHYRCTIHGPLDAVLLQRAWAMVVERCDMLRTSFVWDGFEQPLQVVHRTAVLPWSIEDWSDADAVQQSDRFDRLMGDDRARGFDLSTFPLSRLALIRMSATRHLLLWSHHHIQTDGWSVAVIVHESFACYAALRQGREPVLEPRRPFRDYVAWLESRDQKAAEAYWRGVLRGFTAPTPLASSPAATTAVTAIDSVVQELPEAVLRGLDAQAKAHQVTLNTVVQAAWALVLHRISGQADVVFGTTVSGRPPALAGVEHMVGTFINNLPVRVQIRSELAIGTWLATIFSQQTASMEFDYPPLGQIEQWSGIAARDRLFDSLVLFDNTPDTASLDCGPDVRIDETDGSLTSSFAFTLVVQCRRLVRLYADFDSTRLSAADAAGIMRQLGAVLTQMASPTASTIADLTRAVNAVAPVPRLTSAAMTPTPLRNRVLPSTTPPAGNPSGRLAASTDAPAALSGTHVHLLAIWRDILATDDIQLDDDFFALGGHSLALVRLGYRIEQAFSIRLPLAQLFIRPTIRGQSDLLAAQATAAAAQPSPTPGQEAGTAPALNGSLLQPLVTAGNQPPFFFISGFLDIARTVGAGQPFYGLDCPWTMKRDHPELTFSVIAERCIRDIRSVQPHGPYRIGGHCFGAIVAFAIANQLEAAGERVSFLTLMDPPIPPNCTVRTRFFDRLTYHWRTFIKLPAKDMARYLGVRLRNISRRLEDQLTGESSTELYADFAPTTFSGKLTVVLANDTHYRLHAEEDPRLHWTGWAADGINLILATGDHVTFCREPLVRGLGAILRTHLDQAR